jgi:hypothetical protein
MPSLHLPSVVRIGDLSASSVHAVETVSSPHVGRDTSFPSLKATSALIARPSRASSYKRAGMVAVLAVAALAIATYGRGRPSNDSASASGGSGDLSAMTLPVQVPETAPPSDPVDAEPAAVEAPVVRVPPAMPSLSKHPIGVSPTARPDIYARRY